MYDRFLKERGLKEEKLGGFSRKPRLLQFPSSPIHSSMVNSYCKHGVHPYYLLQKEPSQLHQIDNMTEQCSLFHTCTFKHCWLVDNLYWLVIIVVSFGTEISCVMLVTVLIFTSKKIIPPDCPLNPSPSSNEVFMFGPFEVREYSRGFYNPHKCHIGMFPWLSIDGQIALLVHRFFSILQQPHNWREHSRQMPCSLSDIFFQLFCD